MRHIRLLPILLAFAAASAQPTPSRATAAVPPDPNEPVIAPPDALTSQADRTNALALLDRARQVPQLHQRGTPPYQLSATFTAGSQSGTLTETWMNGQKWRWTGTLAGSTAIRIPGDGLHYGSPEGGAIPPPVHVLRNAIFWAAQTVPASAQIRRAAVVWNGKPTTCLLLSDNPAAGLRSWDEDEYCIDNASGLLQVHSIVPGTFVDYSYQNAPFHGRTLPSGITIYSAGSRVLDAQLTMTDAGSPDPTLFVPTDQMRAYGPVGTGQMPMKMTWPYPSAAVSGDARPVIVHVSVDGQGNAVAAELSSSSDPALSQIALDFVRKRQFAPNGNTRQVYLQILFLPATQN